MSEQQISKLRDLGLDKLVVSTTYDLHRTMTAEFIDSNLHDVLYELTKLYPNIYRFTCTVTGNNISINAWLKIAL